MWQVAFFALVSFAPAGQQNYTFEGEAFGPQRALICTWIDSFETSGFDQCHDATGELLQYHNGASIKCVPGACEELNAARSVATWGKRGQPPALTEAFTVELVGRISLNSTAKRLSDPSRTVLVEKVISVRLSE